MSSVEITQNFCSTGSMTLARLLFVLLALSCEIIGVSGLPAKVRASCLHESVRYSPNSRVTTLTMQQHLLARFKKSMPGT
jgi:hypothetical protein